MLRLKRNSQRQRLTLSLIVVIHCHLLWEASIAVVSLRDYCDHFPDNLKPVICIIKDSKATSSPTRSTTTRSTTWGWGWTESWRPPIPPPFEEWHESHESSESEEATGCSCDLTCIPRLGNNTSSLLCKQCGNHCDVKTSIDPKCDCAAVGPGLSRRRKRVIDDDLGQSIGQLRQSMSSTCSCSVTCAPPPNEERWDHDSPPFCIFNITGLRSPTSRSVTCECCKSKAALNNSLPDFICVCQTT